jgi:dipeptidyl-peptidase-4
MDNTFMKRNLWIIMILLLSVTTKAQRIDIKDINRGMYSASALRTVTPLPDGESYAQISEDGKQVVSYAYKTGKQTGVLFDLANTKKIQLEDFDDYILSPDGKKMLIQTQTKRIYRHSFTAVYYIYNIETRLLEKLSDYGPQQVPVWSNDGQQVAFVRDNNIFLVKLLYDNAESFSKSRVSIL